MWLQLTNKNGVRIVIDFGKVASFSSADALTNISFKQMVTDAKGVQNFKNVYVRETTEQIAKLLKAKALRPAA